MKQNLHNIFKSGACPSSDDLQQYLQGSLSSKDTNLIEQHIESCELCADAVEGLQAFGNSKALDGITEELNSKVDLLLKDKKSSFLFSGWYKIAAAVAILFLVGGVLYVNNQFNQSNQKIFTEHYKPFEDKTEAIQSTPQNAGESPFNKTVEEDESQPPEMVEDFPADKNNQENKEKPVLGKNSRAELKSLIKQSESSNQSEQDLEEEAFADEIDLKGGVANNKEYKVDGVAANKAPKEESVSILRDDNLVSESVLEEIVSKDVKQRRAIAKEQVRNAPAINQNAVSAGSYDKSDAEKKVNTELIQLNFDYGLAEYNAKKYAQARLWFLNVLKIDEGHYQSNFYAGLCALQLGQTDECVSHLNKVIEKENETLYEPALWYLSLAYIKADDNRKAKKYLKKIVPLNGEYKKNAEELLGKM